MNKEKHDQLLYKLAAIMRDYDEGKKEQAFTNLLRVNLDVIAELYETQQSVDQLLKTIADQSDDLSKPENQTRKLRELVSRWNTGDQKEVFSELTSLARIVAETAKLPTRHRVLNKTIDLIEKRFINNGPLSTFTDLADIVSDEIFRQMKNK